MPDGAGVDDKVCFAVFSQVIMYSIHCGIDRGV